jgi:hypothetical protein
MARLGIGRQVAVRILKHEQGIIRGRRSALKPAAVLDERRAALVRCAVGVADKVALLRARPRPSR